MTRKELKKIRPPLPDGSFFPIAHHRVLEVVEEVFESAGLTVVDEEITLARHDLLMACEWTLDGKAAGTDGVHLPLAAVFNGNDRHHALRVGLGTRIKVCTNGTISAEKVMARKHTVNCETELPGLVEALLHEHRNWHQELLGFLTRLSRHRPRRPLVHHILVTAMERGVIPSSHIKKVLDIYDSPTHDTYGMGTLHTLHCAFTEVIRAANAVLMPTKTMHLNEIMREVLLGRPALSAHTLN